MSHHAPDRFSGDAGRAEAIERSFVRFYEGLLLLLGDVPLAAVLERIYHSHPEPSEQRLLLGHLQDSLRHLHAERGECEPRAVALEELIAALKAKLGEPAH